MRAATGLLWVIVLVGVASITSATLARPRVVHAAPPVVVTDTLGAPHCTSWLFATQADTTFYETHCVGGARPDSIANPEERR